MPCEYPDPVSYGYFPLARASRRGDRNPNVNKAWLGEDFGSKLLTCCPGLEAPGAGH